MPCLLFGIGCYIEHDRLGGPTSMPCFQSTHILYCSQCWTSRPYSDKLTAHPDNQTIGSKDDVPASRHGQRIIITISSGRNLWPVLPRDRSSERGLMAAERPQIDHHAHCGASRTSVQDEAARRAARSSQEQPGDQPGAARSSQESNQEQPEAAFYNKPSW